MRVSDYDYDLPDAAIAQLPAEPRSAARLLVGVDAQSGVQHRCVAELPQLVGSGDVVVVNETRVLPARLRLKRESGGGAEVFLLERRPEWGPDEWEALVRPGRRLRAGDALVGRDGCTVVEVGERIDRTGRRRVRLVARGDDALARYGEIPLPPYIRAPVADPERYQTVYARVPGSVAAPTAGLHLTSDVLEGIRAAGAAVHAIELAVGLGTFRPIVAERIEDHSMHEERYSVSAETLAACAGADRVVAVGTTTVRALEAAVRTGVLEGRTDLFITPGFDFRVVDVLLTNFHMPRSSLLVMLDAFMGAGRWRPLYEEALRRGYRFLSFGDAMLVGRASSAEVA